MTHTAPSDSCFLAPDVNTLTYLLLLTLPSIRVSIRYSTEYSSSKKLDSPSPTCFCPSYSIRQTVLCRTMEKCPCLRHAILYFVRVPYCTDLMKLTGNNNSPTFCECFSANLMHIIRVSTVWKQWIILEVRASSCSICSVRATRLINIATDDTLVSRRWRGLDTLIKL